MVLGAESILPEQDARRPDPGGLWSNFDFQS